MKKLVFIIGGIDIVLLAVCMFLYLGKDRTAPVISFGENAVSYEEGMDESLLLQGVVRNLRIVRNRRLGRIRCW